MDTSDNDSDAGGAVRIGLPTLHSRLHPKVMALLGIPCLSDPRRLVFRSSTAAVFLLRGWDIASMVQANKLDIGFAGRDTIEELELGVVICEEFQEISSPIGLCKKRTSQLPPRGRLAIATEYPHLTRRFLATRCEQLEILTVHGATEVFPHLEGIDGIVDIVETGSTLKENDLELVEVLLHTYPCLVVNQRSDARLRAMSLDTIRGHVMQALHQRSVR